MVQGEILEGLVARMVSYESPKHLEKVLRDFPPPPSEGGMLFLFYHALNYLLNSLDILGRHISIGLDETT